MTGGGLVLAQRRRCTSSSVTLALLCTPVAAMWPRAGEIPNGYYPHHAIEASFPAWGLPPIAREAIGASCVVPSGFGPRLIAAFAPGRAVRNRTELLVSGSEADWASMSV